jgi:hypothetical protein
MPPPRGTETLRTWLPALGVFLALGLFAGCGGEEDEEADTTTTTGAGESVRQISHTDPEATVTPEAVSPTPDLGVATLTGCVHQADIRSYRLTMVMEVADRSGITGDFLDDGFLIPGEATSELLFVAPDRWALAVTQDGQEIGSYIVIGTRMWYKDAGHTDWAEEPASEQRLAFSLEDFCDIESLFPSPGQVGEKETVDGIAAVHYVLPSSRDELSVEGWPPAKGFPRTPSGNLPTKFGSPKTATGRCG